MKFRHRLLQRESLMLCLSITLGLSGFALIAIYAGWQTAAGIFLVLWGNNIDE